MTHAQAARDDHVAQQLQHGLRAGPLLRQRLVEQWRPLGAQRREVGALEAVELLEGRQQCGQGLVESVGTRDIGVAGVRGASGWKSVMGSSIMVPAF